MKRIFAILTCIVTIFCTSSCKRPPLPPPVLLFDQAHGQTSSIDQNGPSDISKLKDLFLAQGFVVQTNITPFTNNSFSDIAAVIISGPIAQLSPEEIQAISKYLNNGGQVCLMLQDASSMADLLASLTVAVANGLVHERENIIAGDDMHFFVKDLPKHPLTKGLADFNMYSAWPMKTALEANIIARTSEQSWVDLDGDDLFDPKDAVQSFPVLITGQLGHGHFIIFGDDAALQNQFLSGNNEILGQNLARWLKEGSYY